MRRRMVWAILAIALIGSLSAWGAKNKQSNGEEQVTVIKRIEPFYPNWAYNNGIGEGYAKVAFYVDEDGQPSEYLIIEYSKIAFGDEFMKVLPKWKFEPAHKFGKPIKSVCHAYWEFYPNRPIVTNALFDTSKRIKKSDKHTHRDLRVHAESELDSKPRMLVFPEVVAPQGFDKSKLTDGKVSVSCEFYIDAEGNAALPVITNSGAPELNNHFAEAFSQAKYERPTVELKSTIGFLKKTYLINVTVE